MKSTYLLSRVCLAAVVSTAVVFAAGCGSDDHSTKSSSGAVTEVESSGTASTETTARGPEISVTGCLTASIDGTSYALTPTDTASTAASRALQAPGRETLTYELVGEGEDFRRHANTVVTARGREDASVRRDAALERTDEAEQRPAAGASGTPTVETKEEVEVNVRRLQVVSVVATGAACPSIGTSGGASTSPPTRP